jgi:hypothetical protein
MIQVGKTMKKTKRKLMSRDKKNDYMEHMR